MDLGLGGKTAYVTGGARGIGEAIADALVAEGVRVAVSDVQEGVLEEKRESWTAGGEPVTIVADLSTRDGAVSAAEAAVSGLGGPPDILVNNVGAAPNRPFEKVSEEDWFGTFNLNFMSHVRTSRVILPLMQGRGGAVVNMSSDLAKQPEPVPADYGAFKAALLSLSKSLALEYAPDVRVNAICAGPVWTDLWTKPGGVVDNVAEMYGLPREEAIEKYLGERRLPLGIGEPADVAAMTLFLVSPRSKFVTASAFDVGGGSVRSLL